LGVVTESSGAFELPDTSIRAPDAAWVFSKRLQQFTEDELETFAPLCPDFVVELRSKSDQVAELQVKMSGLPTAARGISTSRQTYVRRIPSKP